MKKLLARLTFLALALAPGFALAQTFNDGVRVQQSPTRQDAAQFMASTPAPATACATVNTTTANGTVTITPPAGQYVYITGVFMDIVSDATGTAQVAVATWANLANPNGTAPVYALGTLTSAAASSNGAFRQIAENYNPPLRSASPGVVVTLTPSAQEAHTIFCPRVMGYFAP